MDGILLIDKPRGWTSFDAVNKIRRTIEQAGLNTTGKKRFPVGHTGTLDPLASGLLVLLLGSYTKRAPSLVKLDKTYQAQMRLGQTSATGDEEGVKTNISTRQPTRAEIETALEQFRGDIMQTPPAYSAVKVGGQRAYKLAREGKAVELAARPARVYELELVGYDYPLVEMVTKVSSGTYIRSLIEDIGRALATGAYMSQLRRTEIGDFKIEVAISPQDITGQIIYDNVLKLD